jgi:hypothetical protein
MAMFEAYVLRAGLHLEHVTHLLGDNGSGTQRDKSSLAMPLVHVRFQHVPVLEAARPRIILQAITLNTES